jgi:hypothetical protein
VRLITLLAELAAMGDRQHEQQAGIHTARTISTGHETRHMPNSNQPQALLLIDVINNFEFPDGEVLLRRALEIAPRLSRLKDRAVTAGVPIIYVNDNFGQ